MPYSHYLYLALGWVATNWVALVAGGYLGHKFGDKVQAYVEKLLSYVKK